MAKPCIMFVDDDPSVLAGLKCMMFRERKRWDIVYAIDGEEALNHLRSRRIDVVVTDMRMPYMDGAVLLNHIKAESPSTVRIMLSGFAEPDAIARALPALHQLLSKPCEGRALRSSIERSIDASGAWAALGSIDRLPSPSATMEALDRVFESATTTEADAVAIIAQDPGLAAKLVQLASSAYFGAGEETTVQHAVEVLGIDQLRSLHKTTSIFTRTPNDDARWLEVLRDRAYRGAERARALADDATREQVFTAALLRDVGRLVLAMEDAEYRAIVERVASDRELVAIELERFAGVTHAELGAWLLSLWGLPPAVTELVRFHHRPDLAPPALRSMAAAIHLADEETTVA